MQKKILMTGITGLVGSAFAVKLLKKNENIKIVALTRGGKGNKSAADKVRETIHEQCAFDSIPGFAPKALKRIEVIDRDVSSTVRDPSLERIKDVDSLFHCAANVNLGKDPFNNVYIGNYTGAKNMVELAKKLKVSSFHHVSTAYVAGKTNGVVMEDTGLIPDNTFNNAYERSKYGAETLVRTSGIPFSVYRPSIIVGRLKDGKIRKPLAFYRILEFFGMLKKQYCAKTGSMPDEPMEIELRMETRGSDKIYFVPIDYVQDTIYELSMLPAKNKTYHITGKGPANMKDIVTAICKILKMKKEIQFFEKIDKPTVREKMVGKFLGDLYPYFASDIIFDVKNVEEALGKKGLEWKMDEARLITLVKEFYLNAFPEMIS